MNEHIEFTPDERRNPRVEVVGFTREDFWLGDGFQAFGIVEVALNGRPLVPLGVVRGPDGELSPSILEPNPDAWPTDLDPNAIDFRLCCITDRMRRLIVRVVLRHAREVDRAEKGQA